MDDLFAASANAQAAAIRTGKVSSRELVHAHLDRIASINPKLNALVQLNPRALEEADEADRRRAAGELLGPLHGVPFTAKDWLEAAGLICAAGFPARKDFIPKADATVVARMRAAGGILLGKSNVQETNPVYGATRNPYDATRSPGASTSGEAALIAACGSPIGLGSDSGGSLRYPAHCCGVATLKPTTGRVPLTGHFPRIGPFHDPRTVIGPLSRHVEDLWLALTVIAGVDWRDASVVPTPLEPAPSNIAGRRIAWFAAMPGTEPDASTLAALDSAVRALAAAGAIMVEATPPRLEESLAITRTYWRRVESLSWRDWQPDKPETLTSIEIERSLFEWDRFRRAMIEFVEPFDGIVCPVAPAPAPGHGGMTRDAYIYTLPFSLTGWPVATVRAGAAADGMPVGVQVAGAPWREAQVLALASTIERATGGWRPPPLG